MRSGVMPQIVQAAFNIMSEPVDVEDVDDEEEETPVPVVAGLVIQSFSMNLSAQVSLFVCSLHAARVICRQLFMGSNTHHCSLAMVLGHWTPALMLTYPLLGNSRSWALR